MLKFSEEYNKKALYKCLALVVGGALAMKVSGGAAVLAIVPVCLSLLFGKRMDWLFFWLFFLIVATLGNPNFFPKTVVFFSVERALLISITFLMMGWICGKRHSPICRPLLGILPYLFWEALISLQGFQPVVSYLKLFLFVTIYMAYYSVANAVIQAGRYNTKLMRSMLMAYMLFLVGGSFVLLGFPGLSQMSAKTVEDAIRMLETKSLFMGMMNHSQAFGPLIAALGVLILGDLIFAIKKFDPFYTMMMAMLPILIWRTSSRTAMGTFVAGASVELFLFMRSRGLKIQWKSKIVTLASIGVLVLAIGIAAIPSWRESAMQYIFKTTSAADIKQIDTSFESLTSSRQGLVDIAMHNFRQKPLLGNGFQVSEDMVHAHFNGFKDYLSAPIEKGVWIYAVLEEGGIVGMMLFAGFLIIAFFQSVHNKAYITASMLVCGAAMNMGEFAYFSMSYTGGFLWVLTFAAVVMDAQRLWLVGQKNAFLTVYDERDFFDPFEEFDMMGRDTPSMVVRR